MIGTMKSLGIRVGMDDFGAGHTSFKNLRRLGFDLVNIDGAFIQNLARSPDDRFFVRTLLDLARHLNIEAVAEWVEITRGRLCWPNGASITRKAISLAKLGPPRR